MRGSLLAFGLVVLGPVPTSAQTGAAATGLPQMEIVASGATRVAPPM